MLDSTIINTQELAEKLNIQELIEKVIEERGHVNILIAGRSGVGKSTLINAVFGADIAKVGQGKPVTQNTEEITAEGNPFTIFDTRGLEMEGYAETLRQLKEFVSERKRQTDANKHIHIAWLCIQEENRRVEDAEIKLHEMLADYVPLITVITKARSDNNFKADVEKLLPRASTTVRVRSIPEFIEVDDEKIELKPKGLEELAEETAKLIPEAGRRAFISAQKAAIHLKVSQAKKAVKIASSSAGLAAATPIPFADAAIIAPIQITMLASISTTFGLKTSEVALSTLISSIVGATGTTFLGRTIVTGLLKMVPGIGTITGGAISAVVATSLTAGLGNTYISVLEYFYEQDSEMPNFEMIAEELKRRMKNSKK
jgi:uncharacterized protein (DUF697 family)/GTP-binding protein EngB required for normal cell division